ncbi:MAG: DUF3885 domain-containing protein [Acidimicrobiales bacterium]
MGGSTDPYDGGADVIAASETALDRLATSHKGWLSPHSDRL